MKFTLFFILFLSYSAYTQSRVIENVKLYGGYTHTVSNDYRGSSLTRYVKLNQSIIAEPLNSPNYLSTWHIGLSKIINLTDNLLASTGFRYVNRGNEDNGSTGIPVMPTEPEIGGYLGIPLLFGYKLISNKQYIINGGITNYLRIYRKKYPELFLDPLISEPLHIIELDLELSIPITQRIYLATRYSNGLRSWTNPSVSINPDIDIIRKEILHSFEISIGYEIN